MTKDGRTQCSAVTRPYARRVRVTAVFSDFGAYRRAGDVSSIFLVSGYFPVTNCAPLVVVTTAGRLVGPGGSTSVAPATGRGTRPTAVCTDGLSASASRAGHRLRSRPSWFRTAAPPRRT